MRRNEITSHRDCIAWFFSILLNCIYIFCTRGYKMMIIDLQTIASFALAVLMGLCWFIADPCTPNKWEVELDRRKRESKAVDGFVSLNLPDSILHHLPESRNASR